MGGITRVTVGTFGLVNIGTIPDGQFVIAQAVCYLIVGVAYIITDAILLIGVFTVS